MLNRVSVFFFMLFFAREKNMPFYEESGGGMTLSGGEVLQQMDFAVALIEAARAGDAEAVERVLRYYEGYINKLCTRTLYDEYGQPHVCVDEYMKRRLEIKLISSIVTIP